MKTYTSILAVMLIPALHGCAPGVDLDAERAALLATDQEWAAVAAEGTDVDRIVAFWADDAKVYGPGEPVHEGKEAIRAMVADAMEIPGFNISWEPADVVIAASGDLGYTVGRNQFAALDADGNLVTSRGRYVTVWRKQADGTWRCVVDMWNAGPDAGIGMLEP